MNVTIFPASDSYLSLGVNSVAYTMKSEGRCKVNVNIIHLCPDTIKDILSAIWIEKFTSQRIIIVTDNRLLPLANYFLRNNPDVVSVCYKSMLLKNLIAIASGEPVISCRGPGVRSCVTESELLSLRYFFNEIPAHDQARIMKISVNTVYAFRQNLMEKFSVRRLSDLMTGHSYRVFTWYRYVPPPRRAVYG